MARIAKTTIRPQKTLELLSHREIAGLMASNAEVHQLFRQCALAVLNTGAEQDDAAAVMNKHADFEIQVAPESRGLKLHIFNAPSSAFVDGTLIRGIQDHLFSALRDIVYTHHKMKKGFDLKSGEGITDSVFRILRNANVVRANEAPNLVVCWGGHSIDRIEYEYTKEVGYQLGLRGINIATGCGIGAMKGPMKGAAVGHAKQQVEDRRYIGITEPGIIASESPNPIVNELVILPDIEKRLEAFVRLAHSIIVFPGGAGTAEEVLYLLGILMHPNNQDLPFPLIFAGPAGDTYFQQLDGFIRATLGEEATRYYQIILGQPDEVARRTRKAIEKVQRHRRQTQESYCYNWQLHIDPLFQHPFVPTHDNMANLRLHKDHPPHELAAALRCAFSGIVAGNVKAFGIDQIREHGPYCISGDASIMGGLDDLLKGFVAKRRMKLGNRDYVPCYKLV